MPTNSKKANSGKDNAKDGSDSSKPAVPDHEVRQESSKAANAAIAAQKKAKELKKAAAGAGDPDERQKLMEQAMDAEIEAKSFGKTAKYLRSGAFQGLAAGTGLGVAPGATLGAISGTLVGGVSSTLLGGLGGGIGAAAGALHGPFWNLGEVAGKGIRKVTGNLPGWAASDEQKKSLEKMIGQANDEEMPDDEELKGLAEDSGGQTDEGWIKSAKGYMPSMSGSNESKTQDTPKEGGSKDSKPDKSEQEKQTSSGDPAQKADTQARKKPRKLERKPGANSTPSQKPDNDKKQQEPSSTKNGDDTPAKTQKTKSQPRKLDTRSSAARSGS